VQKGENINVESIVTDLDGSLVGGRDVEVKAVLKDWQFDKGTWNEVTVDGGFSEKRSKGLSDGIAQQQDDRNSNRALVRRQVNQ